MPASPPGRSDPDRFPRISRINEWPAAERPREKLWMNGAGSLTDGELLAILIRSGAKGQTALDLARRVLGRVDSLRDVSRMSVRDLVTLGVGRDRATAIVAAFELGRRVPDRQGGDPSVIRSPEDVVARLGRRLRDLEQEEFWALLLMSDGRVLKEARITVGLLNSSLVHPRECFRPAVRETAASVIFVHNHPSGNSEPSQEDVIVTHQLVEAGKILGIPVLDHIIIAGRSSTSFAERGLISPEPSQMP